VFRAVAGADGQAVCDGCGQRMGFAMVVASAADAEPGAVARRQRAIDLLRRRREVAVVDAVAFPVYGLDAGWSGRRSIDGWGGDPPERLSLLHDLPQDASHPSVRVTTLRPADRDEVRKQVISAVLQVARQAGGLTAEVRGAIDHLDPLERWDAATIPVDGVAVAARVFRLGVSWVAASEREGSHIVVRSLATEIDDVALATVRDFDPYLPQP
jgi:hypothetical protein